MVEFDVQPCSTGEIIVMHDYTLDRTTNGEGKVKDRSWQYLSRLHMNGTSERIPTLDRVLKRFSKECDMNIELKAHKITRKEALLFVKSVLGVVKSNNPKNRIIFSSFNPIIKVMLKKVQNEFSNNLSIGFLLVDARDSLWSGLQRLFVYKSYNSGHKVIKGFSRRRINKYLIKKTLALGGSAIHPTQDIVDEELIKMAHEKGLKVNVWVVNDPFMMMRLISWGVDGIMTDRPDILSKVKKSFATGSIPEFKGGLTSMVAKPNRKFLSEEYRSGKK
jgi:glycerophosphoryl diester phosphodiesterase